MSNYQTEQIKLSIVIAAWNGSRMLRKCLFSLINQVEPIRIEVLVISNVETGIDDIRKEFPFAKCVILPSETSVPELRTHGILHAKGEIIALSEDLCTFDDNWCREIIEAHNSEYSIIGGAVQNSSEQSSLDWAVFFYDYGKYMPPNQSHVVDALSELNISYKREVLIKAQAFYSTGFSEIFVNYYLKANGYNLFLTSSAIVFHGKNYKLRETMLQLFDQSQEYAKRRASHYSLLKQIFFAAGSVFLPVVLLGRIISRTISKGLHNKELILSLPYLGILVTVWVVGECYGYSSAIKIKDGQ